MKIKNQSGIALIIVVSIMAVLASIAAAFSYSMIMDQRAAANYMNGIKADYVARAGIQHAIGVLKKDGDPSNQPPAFCSYEGYDWYEDDWGCDSSLFGIDDNTLNADSCISNDDNVVATTTTVPGADSRWIYLHDSQGHLIGRYAVLVIDEGGKVNVNTAGVWNDAPGNEGWTTGEVNLDRILTIVSVSDHLNKALEIQSKRYGTDGCAGRSGIDDNADSVILNNDGIDNDGDDLIDEGDEGTDDSAEFYIARPYTTASGVSADTPYLTPAEVVSLAGIDGDDYAKFDSYITTFSSDKNLTDSGLARLNINAVSSAMELYSTLRDAFDYWGTSATTAELAQMAVNIIDYRDRDHGSTRIDVEDASGTVFTRYGVEGIRINEVMVRPVFRKTATDATEECKSGWGDTPDFTSTGADSGIWNWTVPNGTYKVLLYGSTPGTTVTWYTYSDNDGVWEDTRSGQQLPDTASPDTVVITSGTFRINISTTDSGDYWSHVELSQSPDCEYVELVNISENAVTMDGWHLEFPNGQVGTVPSGTSISAGGYAVLAVDKDDSYNNDGIWQNDAANGISFNGTWAITTNVHQLSFTNTIEDDIFCDTVLMDSSLRLYDGPIAPTSGNPAGHIVDQVLWDSQVIQDNDFYSMERDDPTFMGIDAATSIDELNDSGIFDSWLVCAHANRGTPTGANDKLTAGKTPADVNVKNSPFANIGEVADVSYSKTEWTTIGDTAARIRNIADRITVSGRRLDAEFADYTPANWTLVTLPYNDDEVKNKYGRELYDATDELYWFKANSGGGVDDEDTWTWYTTIDRFEADTYIMYVYGREGGTMRVRVGNDTAIIIPSTDYGARFGQVVVSDTTLSVAVSPEDSDSDSTYFDYILLTPAAKTYGRININTASAPVIRTLKGLYGTGVIANAIVAAAPFQTIGQLVTASVGIGTTNFQAISNLITTKSNVFKIICTGQSILDKNGDGTFDTDDEVLGERKISVIYER